MRTRFSTLFSFFVLILTFSACSKCDDDKITNQLPNSIKGMTLSGTIKSGIARFTNEGGYSFSTSFETDHHFQSVNSDGALESKGEYIYVVTGRNTANLTLTDFSGLHSNEKIEVTLNFASPTAGTYTAKLMSSEQGEHSGTFELR